MPDAPNDAPEELPIYKRVDKLEEEVASINHSIEIMAEMMRIDVARQEADFIEANKKL